MSREDNDEETMEEAGEAIQYLLLQYWGRAQV